MNDYRIIDLDAWVRKDLFIFYRSFDMACFNISVKLKVGELYKYAKSHDESFFLLALYSILRASNMVPQMRQRIIDDKPVEFEKIAVMTPVMTEHEMFHQVWCEYFETFDAFKEVILPKVEAAKNANPAPLPEHGEDFICASCVPWLHFESITQAEYRVGQAVPILAWGKLEDGLIPFNIQGVGCLSYC